VEPLATKVSKTAFWFATGLFLLGFCVEYYAHALGSFILTDCGDVGRSAIGRCAWPYRLALAGIAMMLSAALVWCWLIVRAARGRGGRKSRG